MGILKRVFWCKDWDDEPREAVFETRKVEGGLFQVL
jgi:hypothetical protein